MTLEPLWRRYLALLAPADEAGASASPGSGGEGAGAPASNSDAGPSQSAGATPSTSAPVPNIETGTAGASEGSVGGLEGPADFDFGSLFEAPPVVAPAVQQPVPPAPSQTAQQQVPPVVPPEAVQPVQATAAPPQSSPQPPAAAPSLDLANPYTLALALHQQEAGAIQHLAENQYKLTPEDIEGLENDIVGTIPRLLSKVAVRSQQQFLTQMARLVPVMIQRHQDVMQRHSKNEDTFYARWPDIDRNQHRDLVMRYGAVYRQMNPEATLEKMVEDLGPMIMMAAKIQPKPLQPPSTAPNGRGPSPFVPARPGTVGRPQQVEANPWDYLGRAE